MNNYMKTKKQDLNKPVTIKILYEVVDVVLDGVDKMINGVRGEINGLKGEMNERFDKLEEKMDYSDGVLQHQISDLKYDTPTQKEFDDLKNRVDRFVPA